MYSIRSLQLPQANIPTAIERSGPCPRGFEHTCQECKHMALSLENLCDPDMFLCLDMTSDDIRFYSYHNIDRDVEMGEVEPRILAVFKDAVLMDRPTSGFVKIIDLNLYDMGLQYPAVYRAFYETFRESLTTGEINVEKQQVRK